ncbi:MAG: hypothetical protein GC191_01755 [Azospirillum sp.]|nr:hypothetical protein [Azospirillum sp.]
MPEVREASDTKHLITISSGVIFRHERLPRLVDLVIIFYFLISIAALAAIFLLTQAIDNAAGYEKEEIKKQYNNDISDSVKEVNFGRKREIINSIHDITENLFQLHPEYRPVILTKENVVTAINQIGINIERITAQIFDTSNISTIEESWESHANDIYPMRAEDENIRSAPSSDQHESYYVVLASSRIGSWLEEALAEFRTIWDKKRVSVKNIDDIKLLNNIFVCSPNSDRGAYYGAIVLGGNFDISQARRASEIAKKIFSDENYILRRSKIRMKCP